MPLIWSTHSMCSHANGEMARFETIFQCYVTQIRKHGIAAMALLILLVKQTSKSIVWASFFPEVKNDSGIFAKFLEIRARRTSIILFQWVLIGYWVCTGLCFPEWMNDTDWPSLQLMHFTRIWSMEGCISFSTRVKLFVKQKLDTRSGFLQE